MKASLFIVLFMICRLLSAQGQGFHTLKVEAAPLSELISPTVQNQLENKMKTILLANGIMEGYNTRYLLVTQIAINGSTVVEGIQKISVVKFDMTLQVKSWSDEMVFASESIFISDSGSTDSEALKNAISKIKPDDGRTKRFFKNASENILLFYEKECQNLMAQAERYAASKDFATALSILSGIPQAATCHGEANRMLEIYYKEHQHQTCNSNLQRARMYTANKEFQNALHYLGRIDRETSCVKEADALLTEIGSKIDADDQKEWDLLMMRQEGVVDAAKVREEILNKILEGYNHEKIRSIGG